MYIGVSECRSQCECVIICNAIKYSLLRICSLKCWYKLGRHGNNNFTVPHCVCATFCLDYPFLSVSCSITPSKWVVPMVTAMSFFWTKLSEFCKCGSRAVYMLNWYYVIWIPKLMHFFYFAFNQLLNRVILSSWTEALCKADLSYHIRL